MKKIVFLLVFLLSISFTLSAQGHGKNRERRHEHRQNMIKELSLTDEQKAQVEILDKDFKEKKDALHNDNSLSNDEKNIKREGLRKAYDDSFKSILTPEQQQKAEKFRKERPHRKHDNRHNSDRENRRQKEWDTETEAKFETLKKDFVQKKEAIERSRIAPEEQQRRIAELEIQFKKDKKELFKDK